MYCTLGENKMSSGCGCCGHDEHGHEHGGESNQKALIARLIVALAIVVTFAILDLAWYISLPVFLCAWFLAGYEVIFGAVKNILKGKLFDENFLMTVATVAAFAIGDFTEGVAVMIFFGIGELLQGFAVQKSRKNISSLMGIKPDFANIMVGNEVRKVDPNEVKVGDTILVRPGENIPLDGVVTSGQTFVDTRALTGESVPRSAKIGDNVLSGSINQTGVIEVKVAKEFGQSTVAKILELVEHASQNKSKTEKFITKFAKVYTPIVVLLSVAVAVLPPLFGFGNYAEWIYRAITFLVISCPCALVVSIPIGVFGGIGGAARNGILIKGGNYLEALNSVDTMAFDKTGTLTHGVFEVVDIKTNDCTKEQLIEWAAIAEKHSNHPIAKSIVTHYGKNVAQQAQITEHSGQGVQAQFDGHAVYVGNAKLMESIGITGLDTFLQTTVYVAFDGEYKGCLLIADKVKQNAKQGLQHLKAIGINKTVMLTGDSMAIAGSVSTQLGLDEYYAQLLPQDKVSEFEKIKAKSSGKTIFVGDGINDAPVLALADIGIAMGGIGSDAAIESADIVIMNDDVDGIAKAITIARKTKSIIRQNIVFALGIKLAVVVLALFSITSIWMAIFADVGVALLAILNATRALRVKEKNTKHKCKTHGNKGCKLCEV